jgi:NADP-dependent 3-hydroxy acid dehydrogenase YdfG
LNETIFSRREKIVFITGASSGLGAGLAERFVRDGHVVIATARRKDRLDALAARLNSIGPGRCVAYVCDVQSEMAVIAAVNWAESEIGAIDIMIANAGVSESTSAEQADTEKVRAVLHQNVLGVVHAFHAVIPGMCRRKSGQLVCMSSLAAYRGLPGAGAYCASKAAVSALSESYRMDLRPFGVVVTLLQPGWIQTPLTDRNQYAMPFRLSLDVGVSVLYKAILAQKAVLSFPWPLAMSVRVLRLLPAWLYDRVLRNRRNSKR